MKPIAYGNLCSRFYDAIKTYAPEKEVSFYASFIENSPGRVLEAMSGSGRLQIPLLQKGYTVDGIDNSQTMLNNCRQRCKTLNLKPILYAQSLENMSLQQTYSTVTIAVGSFQLITQRSTALKSLQNIHAHMHNYGNLLIDIFIPDVTSESRTIRYARLDNHNVIRLTTRHVFDEKNRLADAFCLYELLVNGIIQQQENELIQVTWYTDDEWISLLHDAGFKVIKFYDETFRSTGPSRIIHAQAINGKK